MAEIFRGFGWCERLTDPICVDLTKEPDVKNRTETRCSCAVAAVAQPISISPAMARRSARALAILAGSLVNATRADDSTQGSDVNMLCASAKNEKSDSDNNIVVAMMEMNGTNAALDARVAKIKAFVLTAAAQGMFEFYSTDCVCLLFQCISISRQLTLDVHEGASIYMHSLHACRCVELGHCFILVEDVPNLTNAIMFELY